jgi:hypothetical protein
MQKLDPDPVVDRGAPQATGENLVGYLYDSRTINDEGQIGAEGWSPSTGHYHALLLTPTTRHWALSERPKVVVPENIRKQLQQRLRIGGPRSRWGQPDHVFGPGTGPTN